MDMAKEMPTTFCVSSLVMVLEYSNRREIGRVSTHTTSSRHSSAPITCFHYYLDSDLWETA